MFNKILPSKVDQYLEQNNETTNLFSSVITDGVKVDGNELVEKYFDPMVQCIYKQIDSEVSASTLTQEQAYFYIKEISVFARYNSQFLHRASKSVSGFCPELSHELMRNHLEEGGERGKLPAHYIVFTSALLKDLNLMVNGYVPKLSTTHTLIWMHDVLSSTHCPSTLLGMYYATEAVAISETKLLRKITNRLGELLQVGTDEKLPNLDFYYRMHLDNEHFAATDGKAVEEGHQEGIAKFIRKYDLFGFQPSLIIDGFLQMLGPFVEQWTELHVFFAEDK